MLYLICDAAMKSLTHIRLAMLTMFLVFMDVHGYSFVFIGVQLSQTEEKKYLVISITEPKCSVRKVFKKFVFFSFFIYTYCSIFKNL